MKYVGLILLILSLSGCDSVDRNDSLEVAKAYMKAYSHKDGDLIKKLSNGKEESSFENIYSYEYLRIAKESISEDMPMYVFKIKTDFKGNKIYRRMLVETTQNPEDDTWYVSQSGIAPLHYK